MYGRLEGRAGSTHVEEDVRILEVQWRARYRSHAFVVHFMPSAVRRLDVGVIVA